MKCKHDFISVDNEGIYGNEICRFCGESRINKKETIKTIKRHLKGLTNAVEQLEKE